MSFPVRAALAVVLATGLVTATGPVAAEVGGVPRAAAAAPVILGPADGAVVGTPVRSVTVDFTGVEPGTWYVRNNVALAGVCQRFACPGDTAVQVGAGDTVRSVQLDEPLRRAGEYHLRVDDDPNGAGPADATSAFTLTSDASYDEVGQDDATFTPRARDGVTDTTTVRFRVTGGVARPTARVVQDGGGVATADVFERLDGTWSAVWDGRDDEGGRLDEGRYVVAVDVRDADGVLARLERTVTIAPSPSAGTSRLDGNEAGSLAAEGGCRVRGGTSRDPRREVGLRCFGPVGAATASYRVRIGRGAEVQRFWVRGRTSDEGPAARVTTRLTYVGEYGVELRVRATGRVRFAVQQVNVRWRLPASR